MPSYTDIHWGTKPTSSIDLNCPKFLSNKVLGNIVYASYVTVKGDKVNIFRHKFDKGTRLLKAGKKGIKNEIPKHTISIGRAIDFELDTGERVILPASTFFVCNNKGSLVWMVGRDIPYDIEKREDGPIVTIRGIEN